jgi:uncharacterized surface protein with fasciclin (FAS1) repeats
LTTLAFMTLIVTSCKDDIPEEYQKTEQKDMLSDYLKNHEDFSLFARMVEKAGKMDLFSTYGTYTCFAPTNAAVNSYLASQGLSSVEEFSNEECDTLVSTMTIASSAFTLSDLRGITFMEENNMLGRALKLEEVPIVIQTEYGEEEVSTFIINGTGRVIYELANDTVLNGFVHPVDGMVRASSDLLPDVIKKDPTLSIWAQCLLLTGLNDDLVRRKDESYNYHDFEELEGLYHSDNHNNWCWVPRTRNYGYTAFCVQDEVLNHYSEYPDVTYNKNIYTWEDLYDYACTIYTEGAGESYYGKSASALKDARNPLHKLIAYHLLPRRGVYEKLYSNCTILRTLINPTEWYQTMSPLSTLKVECVYPNNEFHEDSEQTSLDNQPGVVYLNHIYDPRRPNLYERGAMVYKDVVEEMRNDQNCENGVYYYIDRLIDYGSDTQNHVFNARMRMDLYTFWPELMNNDIRTMQTNLLNDSPESKTTACKNYIFPQGYLDNVESSNDGDFIYQGARNYYWSYEGDEFNLRSDQGLYDMTFRLPPVPDGQYQIRLGFALIPSRGIGQFYVDGLPQGIPLDMRSTGWTDKTGWQKLLVNNSTSKYMETAEQNKKDLHNQGWYHGPASVRCIQGNTASPLKDEALSLSNSTPFCNIANTIRRVIYTGHLSGDKQHTIRIRSVWSEGGAELMFDYIEIVPKSVYGIDNEGAGEDDL